jgi:uncharacterized repeat protein (TIGR03837 family)
MHKANWDIFCKVVDNFGDIGVCWRLARQLRDSHGLSVRLWVDDLQVAQRLIPTLDVALPTQTVEDIVVIHWDDNADFSQAADVVIEAFACDLPAPYLVAMQTKSSKWINLEYLSAETWVVDFHVKPSPQQNGLVRYFYFPGFTPNTGGLLTVGRHPYTNKVFSSPPISALKVSLFCYPHAPIHHLLQAMAKGSTSTYCYVPMTSILPQVAAYFELPSLQVGQIVQSEHLTVEVLPFLTQEDYDTLLAHCDINFVRGEDSWVRAIWANKPFIWQPYLQEDNAHIQKLNAFLAQFYAEASVEVLDAIQTMHDAWVSDGITFEVWHAYLAKMKAVKTLTQNASIALQRQPDLASKLVIFCNNL